MLKQLLLLGALCCTLGAVANAPRDSIYVYGEVLDHFSRVPIERAFVSVLRLDSTVVSSDSSSVGREYRGTGWSHYARGGHFSLRIPEAGKYLLKSVVKGYQTTITPLDVPEKEYRRRVRYWNTDVLMKKERQSPTETNLGEAVVAVTKIKMVTKGDTVVFNASAFQLSEGSMLEQLLAQMPGMKLEDGGKITFNGQHVEELLVNGKDFFQGDPKIALENLPAYMVDKVKVYRKEGEDAYLMSSKTQKEKAKKLVVDVNLKRQYNQGWIASVEAAGGTDDRYLGRLFALRYTDHSRLSIFANANNLNDTKTPGREGDWNTAWQPSGTLTLRMAGLNFDWDDKKSKAKFNSNLLVTDETTRNESKTSGVTYLADGDTHSRSHGRSTDRQNHVQWGNSFRLPAKKYYLSVSGNFDYFRNRTFSHNRSATFNADPLDASRVASLDSLYAPAGSPRLMNMLITAVDDRVKKKQNRWRTNVSSYFSMQLPLTGDRISFSTDIYHEKTENRTFSHYDLRRSLGGEFRNRYDWLPSKHYSYRFHFGYSWNLSEKIDLGFSYAYQQEYQRGERSLHRLDSLGGWNVPDAHPLGALPSTADSLHRALDFANSYLTGTMKKHNSFTLSPSFLLGEKTHFWVSNTLNWGKKRINDFRNRAPQYADRRLTSLTTSVNFYANGEQDYWFGSYSHDVDVPEMSYLLPTLDTSDPLVVQLGNPDLKNIHRHEMSLARYGSRTKRQQQYGISFNWGVQVHSVAQAMTYDRVSGVTTYRPRNVDGNWYTALHGNYSRTLDSLNRWQISTSAGLNFRNNADYVSDGLGGSLRSSVRNFSWNQHLSLAYSIRKTRLSAKVGFDWTHLTSRRTGFDPVHAIDLSYGVTANTPLVWGIELGTDFTLYSRRGYEDALMNDDRFVWNASLSKTFLKKRLMVGVEGFDILGQLDNVRRSINSQGRSETWYNTVPRYFLLRLSYRLTVAPKKQQ